MPHIYAEMMGDGPEDTEISPQYLNYAVQNSLS